MFVYLVLVIFLLLWPFSPVGYPEGPFGGVWFISLCLLPFGSILKEYNNPIIHCFAGDESSNTRSLHPWFISKPVWIWTFSVVTKTRLRCLVVPTGWMTAQALLALQGYCPRLRHICLARILRESSLSNILALSCCLSGIIQNYAARRSTFVFFKVYFINTFELGLDHLRFNVRYQKAKMLLSFSNLCECLLPTLCTCSNKTF